MAHSINSETSPVSTMAEQARMADPNTAPQWRAWGTVREDYSADGGKYLAAGGIDCKGQRTAGC